MVRVALLVSLAALAGWPEPAAPRVADVTPRCFGAAARDPRHPCFNPALRHVVIPRPADAPLLPDGACVPVLVTEVLSACAFGPGAPDARPTLALIGDSHAAHLRAALEVAARAGHRPARSLTRPACPFSQAIPDIDGPARTQCIAWNRAVLRWLTRHPRVRTIVTSGYTVRPGFEDAARFAEKERGFLAAWAALPRSVRHVIVVRDTPKATIFTLGCVEHAVATGQRAGRACAVPREVALQPDPAVAAASELHSQRVRVVDLTRYMCGPSKCYPVVGGALVHRDDQHLTAVYATTLGPYLLRALAAGEW